jgi:hypothetical protein
MLIDLCTLLEGFSEGLSFTGEDHEFLEGKTATSVGSTIQDIEGRDREDIGFLGSRKLGNVSVKWNSLLLEMARGKNTFSAAAARVQAIETPRMAFAPSFAGIRIGY